ncbi:MAG: TAT-variant-translocated molybdopterin oxidoreductase [bacterium]
MSYESKYWKSLRELYDGKSVSAEKANEFMAGVTDEFDLSQVSSLSRKQFLALLTASAAFTSAGCSSYNDRGEIVPYNKKPEEVTPGAANYYASTCDGCSQSCGILVKTREGRPIKIDGNPDHPINRGKICAKGQASILNLYDPVRLREPQFGTSSGKTGHLSWKQADAEIVKSLEQCSTAKKEIALISHPLQSPTAANLLEEFRKKYPATRLYTYALHNNATRRQAWVQSYATTEIPVVEWENAKVVLALESDFLGTEGDSLDQIRRFTDSRDIMKSKELNRLYVIESRMSLTGANADYRMRLRPDAQLEFVIALINEIVGRQSKGKLPVSSKQWPTTLTLSRIAEKYSLSKEAADRLVNDLLVHAGSSMVWAGDILPAEVHIAVIYLNELLGNGKLYSSSRSVSFGDLTSPKEFDDLIGRMKAGEVGIVIHVDTNPVYHLPKSLGYEEALKSVPVSISLVEADDETSRHCTYVLPVNHTLESWGDYEVRRGVYSFQQPVIAPLYETRQKETVLLTWMSGKDSYKEALYHEYLKSHWEKKLYPAFNRPVDFQAFWFASLHDGAFKAEDLQQPSLKFKMEAFNALTLNSASGYTVALVENYYIGDGRYANNGWLQELPHPVSKIVWDNYAAISSGTAKELGVEINDLIEITLPHGSLSLPVFIQPGQADQTITIELGYGRTNAGPIGTEVGFDAQALLSAESLTGARYFSGARVNKRTGQHELVSTQEHHSLDDEFVKELHLKREIIREGTIKQFEKDQNFLHHRKKELPSITKEVEYHGLKWAMAIDLNKCIGCNACVAGCNVENNIPVVGKEQVKNGREMHWIRIDRYYAGSADQPSLSQQPMLCQHCDNAPCENVCPVVATNHSPDGLNQMVYNRCVGTKYCSNNCPFKVRRYNFFNWRDHLAEGYYEQQPINLMHNPEVTVRSRGVMEKCTFCVQRIMETRQHAAEQGRELKGSEVRTACQDACPATAIVFGDMNDPQSEVSHYRKHKLGYHILEETNARPNVTYLAKLRNIESENVA